jgi:8-oxo-dGTP pyrophosphatase MutT (NUDIX family)
MSVRPDLVACWVFRLTADGRPEILLIRRSAGRLFPGLWQCVTGRLEADEPIVAGALREVAEETRLGADDIEALYETDIVNWFHEASVDAVLCEAVFAARVRPDAAVAISPEHDAARWLDSVAAKALVVWPAHERAIDTIAWLVGHPDRAATFRLPLPGETSG